MRRAINSRSIQCKLNFEPLGISDIPKLPILLVLRGSDSNLARIIKKDFIYCLNPDGWLLVSCFLLEFLLVPELVPKLASAFQIDSATNGTAVEI